MNALKEYIHEKYFASAKYIARRIPNIPNLIIIAGSGIAEAIDRNSILEKIDYSEIPNFPATTVKGHQGEFLFCKVRSKTAGIFSGRFHLYEGRTVEEVCSQIITSFILGVKNVLLTNSAGGLHPSCKVNDIMVIHDIINSTGKRINSIFTPEYLASQFISSDIFDSKWFLKIKYSLIERYVPFREGVYIGVTGPSYESPAEIAAYRKYRAEAIGMSTVLEALCSNALNMKAAGCSLITNTLKEVDTDKVSHYDVIDAANSARSKIWSFIESGIQTVSP